MEKQHKAFRTLDIYTRLCEGKIIKKSEEAQKFGVDERSIQRDIDEIRAFLDGKKVEEGSENRTVIYDRGKEGFFMDGSKGSQMTNSEILAVSKILLESRAFTKGEIDAILDKMIMGCVPVGNMKLVNELISNEKYHYVELHHKFHLQERLWEIGNDIKNQNLLQIQYCKLNSTTDCIKRTIEPVALLFSEYYFYLNAFIVEKNEKDEYVHKYDYPAIFRIDRIQEYKKLGQKFKINYATRFEEGEFRKRIQFMYPGKLMKMQLKYYGSNPEAVLDRLPTAKILSQKEETYVIEAEVYGKGIMMWLLSQGAKVEVLKPEGLRDEMRKVLEEMLGRY